MSEQAPVTFQEFDRIAVDLDGPFQAVLFTENGPELLTIQKGGGPCTLTPMQEKPCDGPRLDLEPFIVDGGEPAFSLGDIYALRRNTLMQGVEAPATIDVRMVP